MRFFASCLRQRQNIDYDAVIGITGEEGVSKTTCSIQLSKEIDKNFDLVKSMIYSTDIKELQGKVIDKHISVICVDEAIKFLYKMNFQSKSQKFLNQLYTLCRQERKITTLCIPRFRDLNEYFRNHRVKYWVYVVDRGIGAVFVRDWSPFAKDPWWMDDNQKILDRESYYKKVSSLDVEAKLRILAKSKNFLTIIRYPDLSEQDKTEYKELVGNNKYVGIVKEEEEDKLSGREKHWRDVIQKQVMNRLQEGYNINKIKRDLGISKDVVNDIVALINKTKLEPLSNVQKLQSTPKSFNQSAEVLSVAGEEHYNYINKPPQTKKLKFLQRIV